MGRQALGKGLEALIPLHGDVETTAAAYNKTPAEASISHIDVNPYQPRQAFDPRELDELAASIREKGIVQPVLIRPRPGGRFELVAGERRLRAAKLAGLAQIPVVIRDLKDSECLEIALIENIQRTDLNPMEEAKAYQRLITEFKLKQDEMGKKVGKDRSSVANTLRLLKLPTAVQNMLQKNLISEGHARALLSIADENMLGRLAEKIIRDGLSVRETERLATGLKPEILTKGKRIKKTEIKDPHTRQLEEELRRKLGTQVRVLPRNAQKGKIEIEYYSLEDLDRILSLLR
ncbi:ParB/RepB/Spo0J family partition protein [candidate division FCPU426 bacterium]|nr:ParB/RepB/Spo0J family partition protein [candidate division FCPU426 bacterium]